MYQIYEIDCTSNMSNAICGRSIKYNQVDSKNKDIYLATLVEKMHVHLIYASMFVLIK